MIRQNFVEWNSNNIKSSSSDLMMAIKMIYKMVISKDKVAPEVSKFLTKIANTVPMAY